MQNEIISYTQHTGEVFARGAGDVTQAGVPAGAASVSAGTQKAVRTRESVHEACCPTGTREPVHGSISAGVRERTRADGFVGTQKAVRARENAHVASGRSMIEMLGVLAIIGVLSVGALSGYRMAMTHYRANEIVDYLMRVGEGALHHGHTQKTGDIPYSYDQFCPRYVNGEEPPFGIKCMPWTSTQGNIPVLILNVTNFPSAAVANAVASRLGSNFNKPVWTTGAYTACPSTTINQCGAHIFFKK